MGVTIESNSIRGEMLDEIIDKVVRDTYATLSSVYGPFGKSVFHNPDGIMHTKDGKNVFQSYFTNNEVGEIFRALMLEAIKRQERIAGDGTTTVSLLYCILTKIFRTYFKKNPVSEPHFRKAFDYVIDDLLSKLEAYKVPVSEDSDDMLALIYTATQNEAYTADIYNIIKEAKGDTYVALSFNSFSEEIIVKKHDKAVLEGKPLYVLGETMAFPAKSEAIILMVKGTLDIRCWETLHHLRYFGHLNGNKDVIICCAGTTKSTNDCVSEYNEFILKKISELKKSGNAPDHDTLLPNRVYVYGLKKIREFNEDEMEDFTKLFYHSDDTGSLMDPTIFEQNLLLSMDRITANLTMANGDDPDMYTAFGRLNHEISALYNSRYQLHVPLEVTSNFEYALIRTDFQCEITSEKMAMTYTKNPLIEEVITELNRVDFSNASYREKGLARKRLERISGKFIEVEVGCGLSKDAVRQADAWRDAITSAQNALNGGIVKGSMTLLAIDELFRNTEYNTGKKLIDEYAHSINSILTRALCSIVHELIGKTLSTDHSSIDITKDEVMGIIAAINDEDRWMLYDATGNKKIPRINLNHLSMISSNKENSIGDILIELIDLSTKGCIDTVTITIDGVERTINTSPVETFDVFKYILKNATTAMDLAMTPTVLTNRLFGNRI